MVWNKQIVTFRQLVLVQFLNCLVGWTCIFKANKPSVWNGIIWVCLTHSAWQNFTEFREQFLKLGLTGAFQQALNVNVVVWLGLLLVLVLVSSLVNENFNLFAAKFNAISLFNSFLRILFVFELYVSKTSAAIISKTFQFAFENWAKLFEVVVNLLLCPGLGNIFNNDVSLWIWLLVQNNKTPNSEFAFNF